MSSAKAASRDLPSDSPHHLYLLLAEKEQDYMRLHRKAIEREILLEARYARQVERTYLLQEEFLSMQGDLAWRIALAIRRGRWALAPSGSFRDRAFHVLKQAVKVWRREGFRVLLTRVVRKGMALSQCLNPLPGRRSVSPAALERETLVSAIPKKLLPTEHKTNDRDFLNDILTCTPPRNRLGSLPIDVVVPVYKGREETLRCLLSVLRSSPAMAYELIVIDDAGPDPELRACLREIARFGLITMLENCVNLGFVKTANRGLALHPDRDVVLLNSDTEVSGDWLDRLHRAAYSAKDVGTVTPLSNNATICSYPYLCQDNMLPSDLTLVRLDAMCAEHNAGAYVEVPTGVGFCMYFRRDCLNVVNLFDEERFGKGYGEENDFCVRAMQRGWRHLLATDTFVYHHGGTSFGVTKSPAEERAMKTLTCLHPDYPALVAGHVSADPARPFRRRLDLARLEGNEPAILFILHNLGGGTERHVLDLAERLEHEGRRAILLRPADANRVTLTRLTVCETPNLSFLLPEERWTLSAALRQLGIGHVHYHHRIGVPAEVFTIIRELGIPYDWTLHDYYSICPRINLIDESGLYCGEPEAARCQACVDRNGAYGDPNINIVRWREENGAWLAGARKVFVPHRDAAVRMARYFPGVKFIERSHMENRPQARAVAAPFRPGEELRIAVIGTLAWHKGLDILARCARDARDRALPLLFYIVGDTARFDFLQGEPNLRFTGHYEEATVFDLLESLRCQCAFFPSLWPETYTYTLSIAFLAHLFPVAFDLGAPAARIREGGFGHVIPLTRDAVTINDQLLAQRDRLVHLPGDFCWTPPTYRSLLEDYYELTRKEPSIRQDAA
jgi:GT2 family glycosyltransferase/glycosyltransferase involved in cell wall biosynthesis